MMKRVTLLALACALVLSTGALAQVSGQMIGSKHDLGTGGPSTWAASNVDRICDFCHSPHQASGASSQQPLWNHVLSTTANYGVYTSDTLNAAPADIGSTNTIGSAEVSNLCMSCHDGSVGVGRLYNDPNLGQPDNSATVLTGTANLGTSLVDDHPINFTYNATLVSDDGGLAPVANVQNLLFGGTVQCGSCHDPHNPAWTPFLVQNNADSALCSQCHLK